MKITNKGIAILEGDNCICKWVQESGRLDHDQNMLPLVLKHIKRGDTVIDAGAFIGDHTIAYSKAVGDNGRVVAFEPSQDAFSCLNYNLNRAKNTECYNFGLGSVTSGKSVVEVEGNAGMNYLTDGGDIIVKTIDGYAFKKLDFIKIDVEGYELEILKGATKTIQKFKPKMLIEINQMALERMNLKREDIFNFLDDHGYTYKNIYPNQSLTEYQMDILCLPK
jgi:FkbM family methyltransferase